MLGKGRIGQVVGGSEMKGAALSVRAATTKYYRWRGCDCNLHSHGSGGGEGQDRGAG